MSLLSNKARIASYNLRVCVDGSVSSIGAQLTGLDADLCAYQEIGKHWSMGTSIDQAAYLAAAQGHAHSYHLPLLKRSWSLDPYSGGPFHFETVLTEDIQLSDEDGFFGVGLSASGQVLEQHVIKLHCDADEQRGAVCINWRPHESASPLWVLNTHLSVLPDEGLQQAKQILDWIKRCSGPLLVMGDLNAEPQSPLLQLFMTEGLVDLYRQCHPIEADKDRVTFSVKDPHRCIDYILGRDVHAQRFEVARDVVCSDHFPIWVEVTW